MANNLKFDKKATAISMLCEGNSIRSTERMTGVHRDTIMRLGVRVGNACSLMMHENMMNLECSNVQVDEIWAYVGKKQRNVTDEDRDRNGDTYTFIALDADSKAIPTFKVGKRDWRTTNEFIGDLAYRLNNRIQLSSDAFPGYKAAVEREFGIEVDYGQIVKTFKATDLQAGRYSPPDIFSAERSPQIGHPDRRKISTSYVERQNLNIRMHNRRLTRLTNAFSKKLENFKAAMGLCVAYHNYVKIHSTIRCTPAMALGVSDSIWKIQDLVALSE